MIQVKPGQKIPLSYVVTDRIAGLVVKAIIEKYDGTLIANVTLTEVHSGDHSDLSVAMPSGVDFVKARLTPYLNDGVTPDPDHQTTQEIFGSVTPIIAARMGVVISCEEQPTKDPIVVSQDSDLNVLLSFEDENKAPIDIRSATALSLGFEKVRPVHQVDTIKVNTVMPGHKYSFLIWSAIVSYVSQGGDAQEDILAGLLAAISVAFQGQNSCGRPSPVGGVVTGTGSSAVLTLTAIESGVDIAYSAVDALLDLVNLETNVLSKSLGAGITLVAGSINQALVQMFNSDFEQLPRGDVDARVRLTLSGSRYAFNVYSALSIEPDDV